MFRYNSTVEGALVREAEDATPATFLHFPRSDKSLAACLDTFHAAFFRTLAKTGQILKVSEKLSTGFIEDKQTLAGDLVELLHHFFKCLERSASLHRTDPKISEPVPVTEPVHVFAWKG